METKSSKEIINLIGNYKIRRRCTHHEYKAEYNRLIPTMSSSSNVLMLYTLYLLNNSSEPLYGKEMLDRIKDDISTDSWSPSHGTHYPVLKKMVKDGLIDKVNSNNTKNYYAITELGRNEFKNKIDEFKPILIDNYKILSILSQICNDIDGIANYRNKVII